MDASQMPQGESSDTALLALQTELAGLRTRIARVEAAVERDMADPAAGSHGLAAEVATLRAELAARDRQLVEAGAVARVRIAALTETLTAIEQSIGWRLVTRLRAAGGLIPQPVRTTGFRLIKRTYWALTPHRMPARRRWMVDGPILERSVRRMASLSDEVRERLGAPLHRAYGPGPNEQLDIFPAPSGRAPIFIFIHGGAWREGQARNYAFPAEMFVAAEAHYVALDFMEKMEAGGDLRGMVDQVRRGIAWVYRNAASFGGDPERIYAGGHSSGAHLCSLALVADWRDEFDLPPDILKGGLLMSGLYEMQAISNSLRSSFLAVSDDIDAAMSATRRLDRLNAPVVVTYGTDDPPEFKQQSQVLFDAIKALGKPVELIEAANFGHMEILESLANPYGPNGRAALRLMGLSPGLASR